MPNVPMGGDALQLRWLVGYCRRMSNGSLLLGLWWPVMSPADWLPRDWICCNHYARPTCMALPVMHYLYDTTCTVIFYLQIMSSSNCNFC